jgi:hypothetical protein
MIVLVLPIGWSAYVLLGAALSRNSYRLNHNELHRSQAPTSEVTKNPTPGISIRTGSCQNGARSPRAPFQFPLSAVYRITSDRCRRRRLH